jgi:pimeloyl-ACP methyl ester carboxylesterase
LLVPNLLAHSRPSSVNIPFGIIPDAAALLADFLTKHAKSGKADIIGMSLGGHTAICTARKYPDLAGTGNYFCPAAEDHGLGRAASLLGKMDSFCLWVAGFYDIFQNHGFSGCDKSGIQIGNELLADMKVASTYRTGQTVANELAKDPGDNTKNWRGLNKNVMTRTCVADAMDDAEKDCLERGKQLRKGNPESMAFKVDGKRHAWDLQDPDLLTRGLKAWVEHEDLPKEFIALR